jgi:long-chain acyl-CoA synthetase
MEGWRDGVRESSNPPTLQPSNPPTLQPSNPPIQIMPNEFLPLTTLLARNVEAHGAHPAINFNGQVMDFQTFDAQSNAVAASLQAEGVIKGDRIGLYCVNADFFAVAYFGIVKAGATVVPINLLLNPKEVAYIMADAGARGLIYFDAFSAAVTAIRAELSGLDVCVCIGTGKSDPSDRDWAAFVSNNDTPTAIEFDVEEDIVVLIYTSGTTGKPKGAMLTHRNLAANTQSIKEAMMLVPGEDIMLVVLPMFHCFAATVGMLFPLLHGCTFVPVPKFDPNLVVDTIAATGATVFMAVPSMYNVLLRLPDEAVPKLASLKFAVSGGAAMPTEIMNQFEKKYGKLIYEGDGPTECSPVTSVNPIGGKRKPASIGVCVPQVEMKITDDDGNKLPHGEIGEICVRGPNVMKGYWNRPEETAESFFGEWFRTGDLGTEDDDGYFFIVDRKKDMIIVNGMNVYPRVVEEILYQHEAVREAAVVGEPNELHGEIPVAYIALTEDDAATTADIRTFCRDHLGRHEIPRKVFFMPELPKNAAGKIVKRELRKTGELERGIDSRN